jgi:2-dehydro-3-deoxy-D-arabinonate dehydratase
MGDYLRSLPSAGAPEGALLPPIDAGHEVWAAGVTYLRSREARETESSVKDVYARVYEAERPELFFKAVGRRVAGHRMPIRVRGDSRWNVPEPELTLVVNAHRDIVGFCAGDDVSSRDIEGENPLYLPQAKVYEGSCALGPGIAIGDGFDTCVNGTSAPWKTGFETGCPGTGRLCDLLVSAEVIRAGRSIFTGETRTSQMKRPLEELVAFLYRELDFPRGVFLMTGTGIVPPQEFSLEGGDLVRITIGTLTLENEVDTSSRVSRF